MKNKVECKWTDKMAFDVEVNDHVVTIDADEKVGGENRGPRPKPLLLVALAGCTSMDVVSILKKMRVDINDLNVLVEGSITEEHPKYYDKIHIIYEFTGKDIDREKVEKAVTLSQERYCGVSFMLGKAADISHEIKISE